MKHSFMYKSTIYVSTLFFSVVIAPLGATKNTPQKHPQTVSTRALSPATPGAEARLKQQGISLSVAAVPVANYVSYTIVDDVLYVSGQLPMRDGKLLYTGKINDTVTDEQGIEAAEMCMLNILAQARAAAGGSLDNIERCIMLTGFVNATNDYAKHPQIINGASNLLVKILGNSAGKHARAAVGVASLPLGSPVEISAQFTLKKKKS